jgi:hypothetical protein
LRRTYVLNGFDMSEKLYRYDLFVATHDDECIRMILDAPSREQACRAIIHGFHGVGVRYIDNYYPLLHSHLIDVIDESDIDDEDDEY